MVKVSSKMKGTKVVLLFNTNSSELWQLNPRSLNSIEEYVDDEYFRYLGNQIGAELIILLGQTDAETGILAFDEEGNLLEVPELPEEVLQKHFGLEFDPYDVNSLEKLEEINPKVLAKKVIRYYNARQKEKEGEQ